MSVTNRTLELPIGLYQELQAVADAEQISPVAIIQRWLRSEQKQVKSRKKSISKRRSALDILADAPGQRVFLSANEVNRYLREERDTWDN